jgi:hypothetical protein
MYRLGDWTSETLFVFRLYNCTGCVEGAVNAVEVGCLPLSQHFLARTEEAKKRQQTAACVPTIECGNFGKGRRESHWTGTIVLDLFVEAFKKIEIQIIHPPTHSRVLMFVPYPPCIPSQPCWQSALPVMSLTCCDLLTITIMLPHREGAGWRRAPWGGGGADARTPSDEHTP